MKNAMLTLSLILAIFALAGCASTKKCPCSTATPTAVQPASVAEQTVAAPAPVEEAVEEATEEEARIPAAVRK